MPGKNLRCPAKVLLTVGSSKKEALIQRNSPEPTRLQSNLPFIINSTEKEMLIQVLRGAGPDILQALTPLSRETDIPSSMSTQGKIHRLASCPLGPATARGVGLLTEMYAMSPPCISTGVLKNEAPR